MRQCAIAILLFLTGCTNKYLKKLDYKAPYAIVYELGSSVPFDFFKSLAQTKELNPDASVYVIANKRYKGRVKRISGITFLNKERITREEIKKTLPHKTFFLSTSTLVTESLLDDPNPKQVKDITLYFTKKPGYFLTGDGIRSICDHVVDQVNLPFHPKEVKQGDSVFVQTDQIDNFVQNLHPKIEYPYFLFTHNADPSAPGKYTALLNDPKILGWFGQNPDHDHIIPLGIGIANKLFEHGNEDLIRYISLLDQPKDIMLYVNFSIKSNPKERQSALDAFINKPYCTYSPMGNYVSNFLNLKRSKFVVSPEGIGLDCHRTWEALIMGAIPIVKTSKLDPIFENLPVLIVNEWTDVNEELLNYTLEKYRDVDFQNIPQLTLNYWLNYIHEKKCHILSTFSS